MKVGQRLKSPVCTTNVVVVRAAEVTLSCGGAPMVEKLEGEPSGEVAAGLDGGTNLGKRYLHAESGLEVMCVAAGAGSLSVDGVVLELKAAKSLPASD
ncbi:MAG TPA: hypothetical protein VIR30_00450 [Nocardioides sp.]|jgi:hypothetical protein